MRVLTLHNETLRLTLEKGQQEHLVLINPHDVNVHIEQQENSSLLVHCISLDGQDSHVELVVNQPEEGAQTRLYGLGILSGQQHLDVVTRLSHTHQASPAGCNGAFSDQLFKYVLRDEAQGSFYGELKVMPNAQKTEAHQTNRNILLSPTAKMQAKPQLEIYADDVKCSHGATTGQLDPQAIFYMQQRGISRQSAQRLLLVAFLSDVLSTLPDETLKQQFTQEIENTL